MYFKLSFFVGLLIFAASVSAADQGLVQMAQQDLVTLGYDPGAIDGQMGTKTAIAISKFQAEQNMVVTGDVSPQLIGALRAAIKQRNQPAVAGPMAPEQQPADLEARQRACLQEKYAAAQEANKKKRGFGRLLNAAARVGGRFGGGIGSDISRTAYDVYSVNATAEDISAAARDLGISEDEIEQCRNPS